MLDETLGQSSKFKVLMEFALATVPELGELRNKWWALESKTIQCLSEYLYLWRMLMVLYGFEANDAGSCIECQQSIMSRLQNILLCTRIVTICVI